MPESGKLLSERYELTVGSMDTQTGVSDSGVGFGVTEETRLILDSLNEFIEREVEPLEDELGETWTNPRKRHHDDGRLVEEVQEAMRTVRQKSAEAGFYAMNLPEEYGGESVSTVTWYRANRHVATKGRGLVDSVLAGPEGPKPLLLQAEGDQVDRYLRPTLEAKKSTAFGQTEPGVGSDSPNMETTAEKDDNKWVLNGRKQWITNAPYADFVQVFARTAPQAESGRYGGITCFLVEDDEYKVGSLNNAVGMIGQQAELIFDDVRLPDNRVLGEVDNAFYEAMDFLLLGRVEIGASSVGHAEFLLEKATEYAREREAFGRPIGEFQGVSHALAAGQAQTYAANATGLRCAWAIDQGERAILDSSVLKWFATNVFWDVANTVVQVHGSSGVAEINPFMDHLEYARIQRIVEGTDEIQLNTIAKQQGVHD